MYIISSRKDFWGNNTITSSPSDSIGDVNLDSMKMEKKNMEDYEKLINRKKVLLLCHGYNNEARDVMRAYRIIKQNQSDFIGYFDVVAGYTWPGGDDFTDYCAAKSRASAVSHRFAKLLETTILKCSQLGVMSHSMGCRISLLAHEQMHKKKIKKCNKLWQYLMAAAVDNESIEEKERYYDATVYDDSTYVFHSRRDRVLGLGYRFIEWDRALGYSGPENVADIHPTTKVINCKHVVKRHGDYKRTKAVYIYIKNEIKEKKPISTKQYSTQYSTLKECLCSVDDLCGVKKGLTKKHHSLER